MTAIETVPPTAGHSSGYPGSMITEEEAKNRKTAKRNGFLFLLQVFFLHFTVLQWEWVALVQSEPPATHTHTNTPIPSTVIRCGPETFSISILFVFDVDCVDCERIVLMLPGRVVKCYHTRHAPLQMWRSRARSASAGNIESAKEQSGKGRENNFHSHLHIVFCSTFTLSLSHCRAGTYLDQSCRVVFVLQLAAR